MRKPIEQIASKKLLEKSSTKVLKMRRSTFLLKPFQHDLSIIDADQGIIEIEDDVFNRVAEFIERKSFENAN